MTAAARAAGWPEMYDGQRRVLRDLIVHGERSRVIEAVKIGVNEFLLKPVSSKALFDRIKAVVMTPRPVIQHGSYYGPAPRKLADMPVGDGGYSELVLLN